MNTDAKKAIGHIVRLFREESRLSQEKLAERTGISYQYLSSLENGKENFTIGVAEAISKALGISLPELVDRAFADTPHPQVQKHFFIRGAILPPQLTVAGVEAALNETHRVIRLINTTLCRVSGRPLPDYIQGNNFSGIVSNILCDSFSRLTPYKHNHDQRYPDLICKSNQGRIKSGLEVKTTIRPGKGCESHNGHSGWHLVACFSLNRDSGDICFVHIMFANLIGHDKPNADWKYVGSKVNADTGSQRTETYVTTGVGTAKLRVGTVYLNTDALNISRWRTSNKLPAPAYSPFAKNSSKAPNNRLKRKSDQVPRSKH